MGKSTAHFDADRSFWQNAIVNSQRAIGQFVDPKRLEAFDKNIARAKKFSRAESDVVVEQVGELRVFELEVGAAATGLDLEPALE